jgi:hypothetical protein
MEMKFAVIKSPSNSPAEKRFGILYVKEALAISGAQMIGSAIQEFKNKIGDMPVLLAYHDSQNGNKLRYVGERKDLLHYISAFTEDAIPWKTRQEN